MRFWYWSIKFGKSDYVSNFLNDLASILMQTQYLLPTRIWRNSKTLIDNFFGNIPNPLIKTGISGNNSSSILDHSPQLSLLPEFFSKSTTAKYNRNVDCSDVVQISQNNVNVTFHNYLNTVNIPIDSHAP